MEGKNIITWTLVETSPSPPHLYRAVHSHSPISCPAPPCPYFPSPCPTISIIISIIIYFRGRGVNPWLWATFKQLHCPVAVVRHCVLLFTAVCRNAPWCVAVCCAVVCRYALAECRCAPLCAVVCRWINVQSLASLCAVVRCCCASLCVDVRCCAPLCVTVPCCASWHR